MTRHMPTMSTDTADNSVHTGTALAMRGLRKSYRVRRRQTRLAVDDVSLDLTRGSWTALLGPNGSGKSTLLRMIATVERPDAGELLLEGVNAADEPRKVRARLGMVFQRPGLDALLTVRENMMLQAALAGLAPIDAQRRVNELLARVSLTERADERVATLSGGMQRRADLARALVGSPSLLLLDEPTGGLDLESRRAFLDMIRQRLDESRGALTVLMSTHLMDEAQRADRVVMMARGRVAAQGTPAQLCARVGAEGVREADGLERRVIITAAADRAVLRALGLDVRVLRGEAVGSGQTQAIEHAARELVRKGVSFRAGSANLADAYLALTGATLADEGDATASDAPATTDGPEASP